MTRYRRVYTIGYTARTMHQTPQIIDVGHNVHAIDTHYVRPLMDASHLVTSGDRAAFVDTGTSHSVPHLLAALDHVGVDRAAVDYVFLTHIHLDHAGGAGVLLSDLPNAKVVLHPRGAPHMVDPERIIKGSRAVYGDALYDQLYGEIRAIPADRIVVVEDGDTLTFGERTFEFLDTPGHALHHYSIWDASHRAVFSGDTFGLSYRELDTSEGPFIFPTTTPTHFDPVAAHASYDRLAGLEPDVFFLTHYSRVDYTPKLLADLHRRLDAFVDIAKTHAGEASRREAIAVGLKQYLFNELRDHGFDGDSQSAEAVVGPDAELNAMGIDVWLTRMEKQS